METRPTNPGTTSAARLTPTDLARLFRQHARLLWCIAAGVVNDRSLADDVLQEAAMIALGKLEQFDPATSFTAWAGQVVRFTALNAARKGKRDRELVRSAFEKAPGDGSQSPAEVRGAGPVSGVTSHGQVATGTEAFDDDVLSALSELDETARACLLMKTTLDLSYDEISRALSIPEGTAMSHVHRARKAMREKLISRGFDTTGGRA
ncbi:MAG: RNA polymerase sigma factor [Phycisphaerales bacterium]